MSNSRKLQSLSRSQRLGVMLVRAVSASVFGGLTLSKPRLKAAKREFSYGPHRDERLDILRQVGDGSAGAIVYIHGGGWISCNKRYYPRDLQFLCDAGYTVFNLEYPLAPEHPHPLLLHSVLRAVGWIKRNHPEIERVNMMGDSAGANLAAMYGVLFCNPELLAPLGGEFGIEDLIEPESIISLYGLLDRGTLLGEDGSKATAVPRLFLQSYGGPEVLDPGPLKPERAITPMDLEWRAHPRCFLGVGDIDFLYESSALYARELEQRGVAYGHKVYPGAPHGFFNMRHEQTPNLKRDVLEFLSS